MPEARLLVTMLIDDAVRRMTLFPDTVLIARAGIKLDRALMSLLVRVERRGPLGIGELAELSGRNYTTVSHQVAKLEELGLVTRQTNVADARITETVITTKGRGMTHALDAAREQIMTSLLAHWDTQDVANLAATPASACR